MDIFEFVRNFEDYSNLSDEEILNLRELVLCHEKLTSLPESIGNLSNLEKLYLSSNQLTSLPESFGKLTKLQKLSLYANQFYSFPESLENLSNLKELYFTHNQLSSLPESIGNLSNLEKLGLQNNQLSSLPESLGNLINLQELYLHNNKLTFISESLGELSNLQQLWLSYNQLTSLPKIFGNLSNLQELWLSHNQLTSLPESFGNLSNLTKLYLNNNQLSEKRIMYWIESVILQDFILRCWFVHYSEEGVCLCEDRLSGQKYVVKIVSLYTMIQETTSFYKRCSQDPAFVKTYSFESINLKNYLPGMNDDKHLIIWIMEYFDGDHIHFKDVDIKEVENVILGLHSRGLYHGDLVPMNVLYKIVDCKNIIKLIDPDYAYRDFEYGMKRDLEIIDEW